MPRYIYLSIDGRLLPGLFHAREHELKISCDMPKLFFFLLLSFLESQKSDKFHLSRISNEDKEITLIDKDVYVTCTSKVKIPIYKIMLSWRNIGRRNGLKMNTTTYGEQSS